MNSDIQISVVYLYTAFNALDTLPNRTKLSLNDGIIIENTLSKLYDKLVGTYSMDGYVYIRRFYDVCREFYYYGMKLKGVFVKYLYYDYYRLHECVEELNNIYNVLVRYF